MSRSSSPSYLYSVEILRGLAALSVAWFHLTTTYAENWVRFSGSYGKLGVHAFFVISGFIIPYSLFVSHYKNSYFPRFIARRMVRLEPPYLLSILLVISSWHLSWNLSSLTGIHGVAPNYSMPQVAAHFLYLIPFTHYGWLNVVYWTLTYEFAFYICVGLAYPMIVKRDWSIYAIFVVIISAIATLDGPVFSVLFLLGISTFRFYVGLDGIRAYFIFAAALGFAVGYLMGLPAAIVSLVTCSMIVFFRVPDIRFLRLLGTISYSLYLIHEPIGCRIVKLGKLLGDSAALNFGISLFALLVCVVAAAAYWYLVERPAQLASKLIVTD